MKVQKYEISRTIDKLKSIVQKNDQFPALGGVLVKDGYLIASNTEMTMQLKLEASKGSYFMAGKMKTYVSRLELVAAMTRAKMCTEEKKPAVFEMNEDQLNIRIADRLTDYQEEVKLQDPIPEPLKIGFDSKLVLETLKAFTCENIAMNFSGPKMPAVVEAEDSDMKAIVLPVMIREE